jgi:hypothetical protein
MLAKRGRRPDPQDAPERQKLQVRQESGTRRRRRLDHLRAGRAEPLITDAALGAASLPFGSRSANQNPGASPARLRPDCNSRSLVPCTATVSTRRLGRHGINSMGSPLTLP